MDTNNLQQGKMLQQRDYYEEHIFSSYFILRVGIAILAIVFPLILWIGGGMMEIKFQPSMSDYYNAVGIDGKSMRDWFVGILWAVGVFLVLYKGRSRKEDLILDLAGMFAILVALFPTDPGSKSFSLHGLFAVSLFVSMTIYIFVSRDSMEELEDTNCIKLFKWFYIVLGILMLLAPISAWLLAAGVGRLENYTFIAEAVGVGVFAIYWLVKTWELSVSEIERRSVEEPPPTSMIENESRVVEVDPRELHYPTGIAVKAGDLYEFKAEGKWRDWLIRCDANGWPRVFDPLAKLFAKLNRLRDERTFLLCGNIDKDDSYKFAIGSGPINYGATKSGQLYLFANDWYCAYGNNRPLPPKTHGPLNVHITLLERSVGGQRNE